MASPVAQITLISLVLVFAGITEARKDSEEHWKGVAARNDQDLLEAIQHLVHVDSTLSSKKKITTASDCHTSNKKDSVAATNKKFSFVTDFEPRPSATSYGDDAKLKKEKTFMKDFEPRPSATSYGEHAKLNQEKTFMKDFEPRPSVTAYGDDAKLKEQKTFMKDFKPRPSVTAYGDEGGKNFHERLRAKA